MADIKIDKMLAIQEGRPGAVHITLIGDNGEVKGYVGIYVRYESPPFTDVFRVEVHKGNFVSPDVDIRVNI